MICCNYIQGLRKNNKAFFDKTQIGLVTDSEFTISPYSRKSSNILMASFWASMQSQCCSIEKLKYMHLFAKSDFSANLQFRCSGQVVPAPHLERMPVMQKLTGLRFIVGINFPYNISVYRLYVYKYL
jgi:hypothetical protein